MRAINEMNQRNTETKQIGPSLLYKNALIAYFKLIKNILVANSLIKIILQLLITQCNPYYYLDVKFGDVLILLVLSLEMV